MWLIITALAQTVVAVPEDGTLAALIDAAPTAGVPDDYVILLPGGSHQIDGAWTDRVFTLRGLGAYGDVELTQTTGSLADNLIQLTNGNATFDTLSMDCGNARCVQLDGTANGTFHRVHFRDGSSTEGTQLLVRQGSSATVTKSTFTGGFGTYGAHLKVKPTATATITDARFTNGSGNQGGSIWNGGTLLLIRARSTGNTSSEDGGAIYTEGSLSTQDCWFEDNHGTTWGGAISSTGDLGSQGDTFCDNAAAHGGAVLAAPTRTVINRFDNVIAIANEATVHGGFLEAYSEADGDVMFATVQGSLVANTGPTGAALEFNGQSGDTLELRDSLLAHHASEAVSGVGAMDVSIADTWFHANSSDYVSTVTSTNSTALLHPLAAPLDCELDSVVTPTNSPGATRDDADNDGVYAPQDCNDGNAQIPTLLDDTCNGIDDDCDGRIDDDVPHQQQVWLDRDGDGIGTGAPFMVTCVTANVATVDGDCDDTDAMVGPAAAVFEDNDGDGYGGHPHSTCGPTDDYALVDGDCDDDDPQVSPGISEVCDGRDNNCDQLIDEGVLLTLYVDGDADGYGPTDSAFSTCDPALGVALAGDCDDADPDRNPLTVEIPGNGIDENCDGDDESCLLLDFFRDDDGDGYGGSEQVQQCEPVPGLVTVGGDCNDTAAWIHPDAHDTQCDGIDDDCDEHPDDDAPMTPGAMDLDDDGFAGTLVLQQCPAVLANTDCNDDDPLVHPEAPEICDGLDNDCDELTDDDDTLAPGAGIEAALDLDGDGYSGDTTAIVCEPPVVEPGDCDDADPTVNPGVDEVLDNDRDDDCDGVESISSETLGIGVSCTSASVPLHWWTVLGRR